MLKAIVSVPGFVFASMIAWRREPAPESPIWFTVNVVAETNETGSRSPTVTAQVLFMGSPSWRKAPNWTPEGQGVPVAPGGGGTSFSPPPLTIRPDSRWFRRGGDENALRQAEGRREEHGHLTPADGAGGAVVAAAAAGGDAAVGELVDPAREGTGAGDIAEERCDASGRYERGAFQRAKEEDGHLVPGDGGLRAVVPAAA